MMLLSAALAALLWSSGTLGTESATPKHTVSTSYATYSGSFTPPYSLSFLGIPYAEPPVGSQRFRKPVPLNTKKFNRTAVIDASAYPDFCVQGTTGGGDAGGAGTEDCLKVNIYTPSNATASSKLPVLFYIHGGGYIYGNPRNWPFDHWINQSPNVVVVSVYYRLSSFGFLSHPSFSDSSVGDSNAGFLDQVQALKWVKQNIVSFGGDPDRVTINGQSAGGGSVQMHLVSQESRGLFHGGIGQSVYRIPMPTPAQQGDIFNFYANKAGCGSGTTSEVLKCLRAAPISALAVAQDASSSFTGPYNSWRPVMDGKAFVDYPTNLFQQGKFARVPLISGSTTNESHGTSPGRSLTSTLTPLYPQLSADDIADFQTLYSKTSFASQDALVKTAAGEAILRCGREIFGNAGVEYKTKAWTYRYNQPNPTSNQPGDTEHAAENWMMFLGCNTGVNGSVVFTGLNPAETAFSQELIAYWLSFVRSSDPNVHRLPKSPPWTGFEKGVRAVLQEDPANSTAKSGMVLESEPADEAERCQFIADKSTILQI